MDLPGHGLTGATPDQDYSSQTQLNTVDAVLAHFGVKSFVLGGKEIGGHDWYNLLSWTGLMEAHEGIASLSETTDELLMMLSIVWGGYLLHKQYRLQNG